MEIEVNGTKYKQRESTTKSRGKSATRAALASILVTAGIYGVAPRRKEMPDYNLFDEIELIQNKKSKLSRSEREYIVREFNRMFEPVL